MPYTAICKRKYVSLVNLPERAEGPEETKSGAQAFAQGAASSHIVACDLFRSRPDPQV